MKVSGPGEAHGSLWAPETDMLYEPSREHMVAIFTERWNAKREKSKDAVEEEGGQGHREEHWVAGYNSLPRRSLFLIQMEVVLSFTASVR